MEAISNVGQTLVEQILQKGSNSYLSSAMSVGITAVLIIVGLLICFLGLKIMRLLAAIVGLGLGSGIGAAVASAMKLDSITTTIVVIIAAVLGAALLAFLRRVAAFLLVFIYGITVSVVLIAPSTTILWILSIAIPLVLAVIAAVLVEPMVIVLTGILGGLSAGTSVASLIGFENIWVGYGIGALLAIAGIIVQFVMHSKKVGKKDRHHANKIKEKDSMENEVEKARHILADDPEDEDFDEDEDIDDVEVSYEDLENDEPEEAYVDLDYEEVSDAYDDEYDDEFDDAYEDEYDDEYEDEYDDAYDDLEGDFDDFIDIDD